MSKVTTLADITTAASKGRMFTDARNALIVYAVLVEKTTRTAIVAATGVQASEISRFMTQANESAEARAAVQSLTRTGSESARMEAAAVVGARYFRRVRKPSKPSKSAPQGGKSAPQGGKSGGADTGSRNPASGPLATDAPVQSARDILAALAVLRDAARAVKWNDDESADLASIALQFSDIAAAD